LKSEKGKKKEGKASYSEDGLFKRGERAVAGTPNKKPKKQKRKKEEKKKKREPRKKKR